MAKDLIEFMFGNNYQKASKASKTVKKATTVI